MRINKSADALTIRLAPRQKYVSLVVMAIQRAIAYRGTVLLNLLAGLISVVVIYYLWKTIFAARGRIQGFSWDEMRTYILVAYAVNALLSFQSFSRMMTLIRTGDIATELLRPIDYIGDQLSQTIGTAVVEGLLSSCIAILLGFLVLHILPPYTPLAALFFVLSVCLGFLAKFLLSFLMTLLCFYTLNSVGLIWAQTAVVNLFSGALIPLAFFPDWLRRSSYSLPFKALSIRRLRSIWGRYRAMKWGRLSRYNSYG